MFDDEYDEDLGITRDPTHTEGCQCLRCHCMDILEQHDAKDAAEDELIRQLELKRKDGTPTAKDLLGWL